MFQITIQNSQRRITGCTAGCNTNAEIPQYHNNSKFILHVKSCQ